MILLSEPLFHPRYLSLVAMPFVIAWAVTPFVLKHRYTGILLDLLAEESVDFGGMDNDELNHLFRDKQVQEDLIRQFKDASSDARLWTARLLKSIQARGLDNHLLEAVREEQDTDTRIGLIELLSDHAGPAAADAFSDLIETKTPALAMAMIDAGHRMSPEHFASLNRHIYDASSLPLDVKAHAVGSLYTVNQDKFGPVIDAWLASDDADLCRAGLIAVGVCRDRRFH